MKITYKTRFPEEIRQGKNDLGWMIHDDIVQNCGPEILLINLFKKLHAKGLINDTDIGDLLGVDIVEINLQS